MSFFTGTKTEQKVYVPPYYKKSRKWLYDLLGKPAPDFPTMEVPGMSGPEQKAQSLLSSYMGGTTPSAYSTGMGELEKTVKGGYDPSKSKEFQGYRDRSKLEEEDAINAQRRWMQIVNMGASTGSLGEQGKMRKGYSADRMSFLGDLMSRERDRQLGATTPLMQGADYESKQPLRQAQAGMQLGALPREIEMAQEQAIFEAIMQELMFPYTSQANIANILGGSGPMTTWSLGGPSELQKITQAFGDIAGMLPKQPKQGA